MQVYVGTASSASVFVLYFLVLCFGFSAFGYFLSLYFYSIEHAPEEVSNHFLRRSRPHLVVCSLWLIIIVVLLVRRYR